MDDPQDMNIRHFALLFIAFTQQSVGEEIEVVVNNDGWQLVGDLHLPGNGQPVPGVLLLNQAAGSRSAYEDLAQHLATRGIASLRIDLRGHGDSVNQGQFIPGENMRRDLITDADDDVQAALDFLASLASVDKSRIGIVGASYSGEEMSEAARKHGYANAYVALSPGSFSDESVIGIDNSGADWLFVTAREDRHLLDIRESLQGRSRTVEQLILRGDSHATDMLGDFPDLAERIAVWLAARL